MADHSQASEKTRAGGGRDAAAARERLVLALYEVFRRKGYDGASIADFTAATGLGRSSLYHHFPDGKAQMAVAVVDLARDAMTAHVFAPLGAGSREERVDGMIAALDRIYASGRGRCVLAALLGGSDEGPLREGLAALFSQWLQELADALGATGVPHGEARERAVEAVALVQGGLVLANALGSTAPFATALQAVRSRLLRAA